MQKVEGVSGNCIEPDVEIGDRDWSQYLTKYTDKYQIVHDDPVTMINCIRCSRGNIQPYSIEHKKLVAVLDFHSGKALSYFVKRLEQIKVHYEITQYGDTDICIAFGEDDLTSFVEVFEVRKRKHYTEEQLQGMRERVKLMLENVKIGKTVDNPICKPSG